MSKLTIDYLMSQERKMAIILTGALETIAKANGRTFDETLQAFQLEVPNVVNEAAKLCALAFSNLEKEGLL